MEEASKVTWLVGQRVGYNPCVGLGSCKPDQSGWKVFGCSSIERPAKDNANYMLQSF